MSDLNNAVVWMVYTSPLISKFYQLLMSFPSAPIITGITVTFIFHFSYSLGRSRCLLISLLAFFYFYSVVCRDVMFTIRHVFFSLLTITWSGRLAEIRWSVCISKSQRILSVSFSRTDSRLCLYHLFVCQISVSGTIPSGSSCPISR